MNDHVDTERVKMNGDFPTYIVKNVEINELISPSTNREKKHRLLDWQKLFKIIKNAAFIISFIISLFRILNELGLL